MSTTWRPIATRRTGVMQDYWHWHLSHHEQTQHHAAVAAGRVVTAQRREPSGEFVLLAREVARPAMRTVSGVRFG